MAWCTHYLLLFNKLLQNLALTKQIFIIIVSVLQIPRHGLCRYLWLRVFHEVGIKMSAWLYWRFVASTGRWSTSKLIYVGSVHHETLDWVKSLCILNSLLPFACAFPSDWHPTCHMTSARVSSPRKGKGGGERLLPCNLETAELLLMYESPRWGDSGSKISISS